MRLPLIAVLALALVATPTRPALAAGTIAAPGRVVVDLGDATPGSSDQDHDVRAAAALADGSVLTAATGRDGAVRVLRLDPSGRPDAAYGAGGVARPAVTRGAFRTLTVAGLAATADGGAVLVTLLDDGVRERLPVAQITRLDARGDVAASRVTDVTVPQATDVAVDGSGRLVLTGATGYWRAPDWVVERFDSDLRPDPSFGSGGVTRLGEGAGLEVVVQPDGRLVVHGDVDDVGQLVWLDTSGAVIGGPVRTAGGDVVTAPGGAVDLLTNTFSGAEITRVGPDGPQVAFGAKHVGGFAVAMERLPDGSAVAVTRAQSAGVALPELLTRVAADGTVIGAARPVDLGLSGGAASIRTRYRAPAATPLLQSGFRPYGPVVRPDGTLVFTGQLALGEPVGEGIGVESVWDAATATTPDGGLITSFGGPATRARVAARIPVQHARVVRRRTFHDLGVVVTASGPGLVRLEGRQGGRVVARSTSWVPSAAARRVPALLTVPARRSLAPGPITVRVGFRDLVGQEAATGARGRLR